MFDLSNGVVRTKLLTDKAQGDVHKEQTDFVKKAIHILGSQVTSKLWKSSGRRLGEKPMQMLIAQELSNTIELKEKPASVVAKLMGLNSLPVQQRVSPCKQNLQDTNSVKQKVSAGIQLENDNPHPEDHHRSIAEKRSMEAKRLTTNEKLLRSKELKDALKVLSSNRDLFLKLLEEPNSLFSSQLKELNQTNSLGNHAKCITVQKPTTSADTFDGHEQSSSLFTPKAEAASQSTRIVVLKAPQKASALSGGYVTDENSLNVSETVTHTSHSFESSASREAKKRLCERWESVISNGVDGEQGNVGKKSSNTLGEMLSIPEVKKIDEAADRLAISPRVSHDKEQHMSITRSESLPASSYCESMRGKDEISPTLSSKSARAPKAKNVRTSLKEKVVGLFFSRMKALVRERPTLFGSVSSDSRQLQQNSSSAVKDDNAVEDNRISDENSLKTAGGTNITGLSPISVNGREKHGNVSLKGIRSIEKLWKSEVPKEKNGNKPSSISALERPSRGDDPPGILPLSSQSAIISNPQALSRSPLISSVSRSSNWETLHPDSVPMTSFKLFRLFFKEDEEQERLDFITKLLSSSNLADERSATLLEKSHSLDSPLNPALLDELLERKGEEAKCRERRSNQMLYFDSVNIALKGICQCLLADAYPWPTATGRSRKRVEANLSVRDAVWFRIKDCFSEDENRASGKAENGKKYVNHLVRREAAGGGLAESMWLEMDEVGKEICEEMLEELFDDTLADLTSCWWL